MRKVDRHDASWSEDTIDKEIHVLRDVWLYHGSTREKDIQDRIFGKFDEGTQEKVRPHFLTIIDDVELSFEQNGVEGKDVAPIAPGLLFAILDPVSKDRISQDPELARPAYLKALSKDIYRLKHPRLAFMSVRLDGAIVGESSFRRNSFLLHFADGFIQA